MQKFFVESGIVLLLLMVLDWSLGSFLDRFHALDTCSVAREAVCNTADIALMGASEMQNQYNAPLLADSLGKTVYNYGCGGQNVYFQYAILNLMIAKAPKKPEYVVLETQAIDFYDTPNHNTEHLSDLNGLFNFDKEVQNVLMLQGKMETFLLRHIHLYKYNTKWINSLLSGLYTRMYHPHRKDEMGYMYIDESYTINHPLGVDDADSVLSFDTQKVMFIHKIIDLCRDNGIVLIFINAPYYEIQHHIQWEEKLGAICEAEHIPFLNYNQSDLFLSHPEWYYNTVHLNRKGVSYYSELIMPDLKEIIQ